MSWHLQHTSLWSGLLRRLEWLGLSHDERLLLLLRWGLVLLLRRHIIVRHHLHGLGVDTNLSGDWWLHVSDAHSLLLWIQTAGVLAWLRCHTDVVVKVVGGDRDVLSVHFVDDVVFYLVAEHVDDGVEGHLLGDAQVPVVVLHDHREQLAVESLHLLAAEVVILQVRMQLELQATRAGVLKDALLTQGLLLLLGWHLVGHGSSAGGRWVKIRGHLTPIVWEIHYYITFGIF